MKILLFRPPAGRKEIPIFPLGSAYIASVLRTHTVRIFDLYAVKRPMEKLEKIMEEENPDVVGISLTYISNPASYDKFTYFPSFVSSVKKVREIRKDVTIIVGGAGFSLFSKQIMENVPEIDFGALLEGEETVPELLENLRCPELVRGLFYRNRGKICFSGNRHPLNFDHLPEPRRDLLDLQNYKYLDEQMGVQTKRGCVFECIYCVYPYLDGRQVRLRSAQKVVDEIEKLTGLGFKKIFFVDSIFNFPPEHATQICRELIRRNLDIKWKAFFNEKFMDQEFFLLAKDAGCEVFIFGPDASAPSTLHGLKKNFTYQEITKAYSLFRNTDNVNFKCTFMFNGPGENIKTIFTTLKLILTLALTKRFQFSIGNIRIYPFTELYNMALEKGLIGIGKDTNLLSPNFYDPFPLRIISYLLNFIGSLLYRIRRLRCYKTYIDQTNFMNRNKIY